MKDNERNISPESRKKMSEGGRKGGEHSHGGTSGGSSKSTNSGGSNSRSEALEGNKNAQGPHNVSPSGRKRMSEGGRKGGEK